MTADVHPALVAERLQLCDFLGSLDPSDWDTPSLCAGWTVRDVVAHLTLSTRTSTFDFVQGMVRHRGDFDEMNAVAARKCSVEFAPDQLIEQLRIHARSNKKSLESSHGDGLTDFIVHGQDIARALGHSYATPHDRVVLALEHVLASRWYPARKAFGEASVAATDTEWSHGVGDDDISGSATDLLLAGTGRLDALDHLTGSGVSALRDQLRAKRPGP